MADPPSDQDNNGEAPARYFSERALTATDDNASQYEVPPYMPPSSRSGPRLSSTPPSREVSPLSDAEAIEALSRLGTPTLMRRRASRAGQSPHLQVPDDEEAEEAGTAAIGVPKYTPPATRSSTRRGSRPHHDKNAVMSDIARWRSQELSPSGGIERPASAPADEYEAIQELPTLRRVTSRTAGLPQEAPETDTVADFPDHMEVDVMQSIEQGNRSDSFSEGETRKTDETAQGETASDDLRGEELAMQSVELRQWVRATYREVLNETAMDLTSAPVEGMAPPSTPLSRVNQPAPSQQATQEQAGNHSMSSSSSDRKRERTATPMPDFGSPSLKKQKKQHRRRRRPPAVNLSPESSLPPYKYISPRQNNEFVRTPSAMAHRAYKPSRAGTPAASRASTPAQYSEQSDDEPNSHLFTESPRHSMTTYTSMPLERYRVIPSDTGGPAVKQPRSGFYLWNGMEELRQELRKTVATTSKGHEEVEDKLTWLKRQGGAQTSLQEVQRVVHSENALSMASKGPHLNETCVAPSSSYVVSAFGTC